MFLALHHCNLHWNILCYCSSCKVDSSYSLNAVYRFQLGWWAHFLIVSGSSSHCSPSLLPCPVGISHVKTCIGWHSNQAGLIWIGRSEQLYGWFLVRVTWKKGFESEVSFSPWHFQAANIPLVSELGIDDIHFDDFSLDVDAMITAALRMFMELGMVQKFKIDYEVTICSAEMSAASVLALLCPFARV